VLIGRVIIIWRIFIVSLKAPELKVKVFIKEYKSGFKISLDFNNDFAELNSEDRF